MSDEKIQIETHNYDPVNRYIDDQARLKRSASTWRYAKASALVMVAAGLLAVLLAWAYYLYKKPHRLVSLSEINQKVLENEDRLIEAEKKLPQNSSLQTLPPPRKNYFVHLRPLPVRRDGEERHGGTSLY